MDEKEYFKQLNERWPYIIKDGYTYDHEAASKIVLFIENYCVHVEGKLMGHPFLLEDWQKVYLMTLFGWKNPDGTRRFRKTYLEIPRKNGKSTMAAVIALYMLLCDNEGAAQVYSAAADAEQAKIVFNMAKKMVALNPKLASMVDPKIKSVVSVPSSFSVYKSLSSAPKGKHGFNAHCVIVDEYHAHPDDKLYEALATSVGTREQPMIVVITTAGYDKTSPCYHMSEYAKKVASGSLENSTFFPVLFGIDEGDAWDDEAAWAKANPNLDVTIDAQFLKAQLEEAKAMPSYENSFKQLYLNIWTSQHSRWISDEAWMDCKQPLDIEQYAGRECFAGLDLASTGDLTALSLVFPEPDGSFATFPFFWVPEETLTKRRRQEDSAFRDWVSEGHLMTTPGDVTDYDFIRTYIHGLADKFQIKEVAADPWNAQQIMTQFVNDGLNVVKFRQGFITMSPACKEFERVVIGKLIKHNGHPVLRWNMSNIELSRDAADNIKINKAKSQDRVDGAVSTVMALGRAIAHIDQADLSNPQVFFI
jgi:phage terminase large subunit-like protein